MCFHWDSDNGGVWWKYDAGTGAWNNDAYPGMSDPYGGKTDVAYDVSIYATYTASSTGVSNRLLRGAGNL